MNESSHQPVITQALTLVSCRIFFLPPLQEFKKFPSSILLKQTHQRAPCCLHFRAGDLADLTILIHKRARDLLELKVSQNIGVNEDFYEFTRGDDELWDKIDCVVAVTTQVGGRRLVWAKFTEELKSRVFVSASGS